LSKRAAETTAMAAKEKGTMDRTCKDIDCSLAVIRRWAAM
jgi:hypothetical protein